ncbi:hypothetical protein BCR39DRAFT_235924 [Naematelia encephala]|uniref:Uncharacterized protein n=1 Tax=Naematelia encephala TaxID=71784 RepID=A0A1Y2BHS8_9TREE|nr:hypothetical protein BCR39DRAFT_235924 [Naematelia encephala]
MSLYSGIKFTAAELAAEAALNASEAAKKTAAASATAPTTSSSSSSPSGINKPAVPAKASAEWSASLKFAPRLNKPKPTTTARPPTTSYSAEPTVAVGIVKPLETTNKTKEDEIVLGVDGKPLAKAPAMTLAAAGQKEWSAREKEGWGAKRDRGAADVRKKKKKKVCDCLLVYLKGYTDVVT